MSKLSKETMYTELSIQIGSLTAKVDKILEILVEQQKPYIVNNDFISLSEITDIKDFKDILSSSKACGTLMTNEEFDREFK